MVNESLNPRCFLSTLVFSAIVLSLAAWLRGAEYDEQYSLFLTAGVPRPIWPDGVFPAGLAVQIQAGHADLATIGRDLRTTDVHPPLYFWLLSVWRASFGQSLFVARMFSVATALGALALTGLIARQARVPVTRAMLLTLGCYAFTYTSGVARGFALAQLLLLGGVLCLLLGGSVWRFALAGALLGAASFTNYLAAFVAAACLAALASEAFTRRIGIGIKPEGWELISKNRHGPACPGHRSRHGTGMGGPDEPGHDDKKGSVHLPLSVIPMLMWTVLRSRWGKAATAKRERASPLLPYRNAHAAGPGHDNLTGGPIEAEIFGRRLNGGIGHRAVAAFLGFLAFLPADLWWFLAQSGSRGGQFPPFSLIQSLGRLASRLAGAILGGLPLYLDGIASLLLSAILGLLLLTMAWHVAWRWHRIDPFRARVLFALAVLAPPAGLLLLGVLFNNTPIEVRYLTFATPFAALLIAGTAGPRLVAIVIAVQAASLTGLMLAPQPARATAHAAAALVENGIVLLPRGNDGVGVVGAFAIEAPPALPLLLIRGDDPPASIHARIGTHRRVVLALIEQDAASRAACETLRRAFIEPRWREVARRPSLAVYERIGGGE
ncbi:MAG: hypothetical protein EXR07_09885 [Acetobacteraceae bacterium]|nr:hypothetical protein [Acetobacteraceae bacterium]